MKGRILNIVLVLALMALPVTANAGWSEAQQATDQTLPAPSQAEETPTPDVDFKSSPVMFIENVGQWDDGARFQVWGGPAGTMWLAEDAIWITVVEPGETSRQVDKGPDPVLRWPSEDQEDLAPRRGVNIKLSFVGANPHPRIETFDRRETTVSYFIGNDPEQWRPDVPVWGGVRYVDLYPGIDLELTQQEGQMTPRLAVRPGADLSAVQLRVEGAEAVAVAGALLRLRAAGRDHAWPLLQAEGSMGGAAVQPRGAATFDVSMPFAARSAGIHPHVATPDVPADNPADLLYGTFLGGSSGDYGFAIAVDGAGSAYVTGGTHPVNFPTTPGAFDTSANGQGDAFVVKLNPTGSGLAYATFLGSRSTDVGHAIAVDGTGSVYVTGYTGSSDFPTTPGAFDTSYNGGSDAFVAKLNPTGSALDYATYLGGSDWERGNAIAVDGSGSAYVANETYSSDFPTTSGAFDTSHNGSQDASVVKLNPTGSALAYGTYLGGRSGDGSTAIAVDGTGSAYVTGSTGSNDFPTTPGAYGTGYRGGTDAFVAKLNPTGSGLAYATFLGSWSVDLGYAIAVDGAGNAYVTGETSSNTYSSFPTTPGAFDTSYNGHDDAFVAKLNPTGSALAYATFLGGSGDDVGYAIAVDGTGSAYVTGVTDFSDFPTTPGAFDRSFNGDGDAFVVKLAMGGGGTPGTHTISGRVTTSNGTGIEGVTISDNAGHTAVTNSTGNYTLSGLTQGTYTITPSRSGYTFSPSSRSVSVPPSASNINFQGSTSSSTYSISGRVTTVNDTGVAGVTIRDNAGHSTVTNASGYYTLSGLSSRTYTITPSKGGYTFGPASQTVSVPPSRGGINFTGYDKLPIVFVHGINLRYGGPCDWVNPSTYFYELDDALWSAGYHIEYARLESSYCYTPPIVENVWRLDNAIQMAKATTNRSQVILIAHSMGGLVSRAYIEGNRYDGDVSQLFTFGTPHQGVPEYFLAFLANGLSLGMFCHLYQPAICDFSVLGMRLFNRDHPNRLKEVTYHVISGEAPESPRTAWGRVADKLLSGADDGAVQAQSGLGLSGYVDRWPTDETHGSGSGSRNYFVRDGGMSTSYLQCLKRILVDESTEPCGTFRWLDESRTAEDVSAARSPFLYGTLLPSQTHDHSIVVEGGVVMFAAQWTPETVAFALISPSGQMIDPAYAAANPGIVTYDSSDGYATYSLSNAATGTWQVRLQAVDVPTTGASYTAFAAFESDLALSAGTNRPWYTPGTTAVISATLSPAPQSASVVATVLLADATSTPVTLTSLGGGRYNANYAVPPAPGYAEVRLVATGVNSSGDAFERGTSLAFQISPNTVALNGSYSDTPEPRWPGASIYQALNVSVDVNVNTTGSYGLSAELVDAAGNTVAHTNVISDLTSGAGTLTLRFDGADIYESQRDGPYRLTNLLLTDHNGAALVVQEAQNVYTTAAYRYRDFRTGDLFLPVIMR